MRVEGFPRIRDLAAIGDGRAIAVLDADGAVRWLCVPEVDSPSVFASLIDPERGGYFVVRPAIPYQASRHYRPHTNLLVTEYRTAQGMVRVTDSFNVGAHGLLSWREIARKVEGLSGAVPIEWELLPRFDYGKEPANFLLRQGWPVSHGSHATVGLTHWGLGEAQVSRERVGGQCTLRAGERGLLVFVTGGREPLELSPRDHVEARIDATGGYWEKWAGGMKYAGEWAEVVERSALILSMLADPSSGAIVAAPTLSLPERLGGDRNWDYRFCWTRDMSFTLDAMMALDFREQANRSLVWLLEALHKTQPDLKPIYRVDGTVLHERRELDLRGYCDTRPVHEGNRAATQLQLGTYGDLFATTEIYVGDGNVLDPRTASALAEIAHHVCDVWRKEDSGIWELPEQRHYTVSKLGCWVTLDRAIHLAENGQLPSHKKARWEREREAIRAYLEERCWSKARGCFVQAAESDALDAACLLAGRTGYLPPGDPRLSSTIDAVRAELGRGPLLYRTSGLVGQEGAFLACSFWMVDALCRARRLDEAAELMEQLLPLANDLGLYSEQIDPATHAFLGNFPQALSHLTLINAACEFQRARASNRGDPNRSP